MGDGQRPKGLPGLCDRALLRYAIFGKNGEVW